jgi:hypothetical protein
MTGSAPFARYGNLAVIPRIIGGERPERPQISPMLGLTNAIWDLARKCWSQQIDDRPIIADVLQSLNHATKYWEPPSSSSELLETDDGGPSTLTITSRGHSGGNVTATNSSVSSNTTTRHPQQLNSVENPVNPLSFSLQNSFDPPRTTDQPFSSLPLPNRKVCSVS